MKNKTILSVITLSAVVLLTTTAAVFAQQLNAPNIDGETTLNNIVAPTIHSQGTICAQDAKLCPDGSYVSRTGSNCEFAPCPVSNQLEDNTNPTYHRPSGNWEGQVSERNNEITTDDSTPVLIPDVAKTTQCSDKIDNDNDGRIDLADPGCKNGEADNFEGDSQCSDEKDNDNDGRIDLMDSGCNNNEADDFEGDSQCSDAVDNDKDSRIDMADPDCSSEADNFEGSFNMLTSKELKPEIRSAIDNLEVKPEKILTPIFNGVATLEVNTTIEDGKVIYHFVPVVNTPIYGANDLIKQPLLDLKVDQPVEFKLSDNKIIINNEQIFDYKNIVAGNELIPLAELKINSAITDGRIHNLEVVAGPESAKFRFIYQDKEVMVPIYSDFIVENQKISLLHDGQVYDLRVLPNEMHTGIISALEAGESGKDIEIKDLSIKVENQKAVYDLKVKEPFRLFWVIPTKINSQYIIDSDNGEIIKSKSSWFSIFGKNVGLRDLLAVRNQFGDTIKRWKVELYVEDMK